MLFRWIACLLLFTGAIVAGRAAVLEFDAHKFGSLGPSFAFQQVVLDGPPDLPPSVRGRREVLTACLDAMWSFSLTFQRREHVELFALRCIQTAEEVTADTPSYGLAHLVVAHGSHLRGESSDAAIALRRAQQTAPRILWLAARRVYLLRQLPDRERAALDDTLRADLLLMFDSYQGLLLLAELYGEDEGLRPVLTELAEQQPEERQRTFFGLSQTVLSRQGAG